MKKDSFIKKNKTVLISIVLMVCFGVFLVYGYGLISKNTRLEEWKKMASSHPEIIDKVRESLSYSLGQEVVDNMSDDSIINICKSAVEIKIVGPYSLVNEGEIEFNYTTKKVEPQKPFKCYAFVMDDTYVLLALDGSFEIILGVRPVNSALSKNPKLKKQVFKNPAHVRGFVILFG